MLNLLAATNHHVTGEVLRPEVVTHSRHVACACCVTVFRFHGVARRRRCTRQSDLTLTSRRTSSRALGTKTGFRHNVAGWTQISRLACGVAVTVRDWQLLFCHDCPRLAIYSQRRQEAAEQHYAVPFYCTQGKQLCRLLTDSAKTASSPAW